MPQSDEEYELMQEMLENLKEQGHPIHVRKRPSLDEYSKVIEDANEALEYARTESIVAAEEAYIQKHGFPWKYNEGEFLEEFEQYLRGTYGEHYVQKKDGVQCFDAWMSMGDSWPTFRNTAVKYLWRFGQKDGFNKKDVYKAIHYVILMYYAAKKEKSND